MPVSRPSRTPSSAMSSAMAVRRQGELFCHLQWPYRGQRERLGQRSPLPRPSGQQHRPLRRQLRSYSHPFCPAGAAASFLRLGISADSAAPERWFGETTLTASGYAASLPVCGQTVSGTALRRALGLRSACFNIRYQDGSFLITTKGYGHGVGLSQWGAKALAEQGWTYEAILAHYFPGTQLCR